MLHRTSVAASALAARLLVFVLICPWVQQVLGPSGAATVQAARRTSPLLAEETTRRRPAMSAGKLKTPSS